MSASRPFATVATLLASLALASCSPERAGSCFIEEGIFEITHKLETSSCEADVIQPSWTEERVIDKPINCGTREETFNKYIGGGCYEDCTEKQRFEARSFSGTMDCQMACGGKNCSYETSFSAALKQ